MRSFVIKVSTVLIVCLILLFFMELFLRIQNFVQLDGFSTQQPWNNVLHHGPDRFVVTEYGSDCETGETKILLLGDSWMEDAYLSGAIGKEFSEKTGRCVKAVNGGNSSYAPSLYLLKARKAYKDYGSFDFIVVNIDETDIGDEWLRYRIPSVRSRSGDLVAVPYGRDIASQYLWNGKLWAEDSRFYVVRLLKFAYFYKILVPSLYEFTTSGDLYSNLMQYVFAPDARSRYKKEIAYFEDRLLEMAEGLSEFTTGPDSIYVTHHPHALGLLDPADEGKTYLPIVSEALSGLSRKTGVRILDARDHISRIHGEEFLINTFLKDDPFSHLMSDGAIRYGKWIGEQMAPEGQRNRVEK